MANSKDVAISAGTSLGLRASLSRPTAYGEIDGFPVQVIGTKEGRSEVVIEIVRLPPSATADRVRTTLASDPQVEAAGIKPSKVMVEDGLMSYTRTRGLRAITPEEVVTDVRALVGALRDNGVSPGATCQSCGSDSAELILINGLVSTLCSRCIDTLHEEVAELRRQYEALSSRRVLAVGAALGLAVVGALVWAAIGVATEQQFWLVAILIGLAIGVGTARVAGKGGRFIQATSIVATLLSVTLGLLMMVAYWVNEGAVADGESVDWLAFTLGTPVILMDLGSDALFAWVGGLFGAYYAARSTGKADIELTVET